MKTLSEYVVCLATNRLSLQPQTSIFSLVIAISELDGKVLSVMPMSAHIELIKPHENVFIISKDDPQFSETGLPKTSAVFDKVLRLKGSRIIERYGVINGDLKARLDDFFGF